MAVDGFADPRIAPRTPRRAALLAGLAAAVGAVGRAFAAPVSVRARPRRPKLAGRCAGTINGTHSHTEFRYAQTFVASRSGALKQVRVAIHKRAGTVGNYVVQLVPVFGSMPAHEAFWVFAASMVNDADVPEGDSTLVANFAGTSLLQGGHYAVVVVRLGMGELTVRYTLQACPGESALEAYHENSFTFFDDNLVVSVFVA